MRARQLIPVAALCATAACASSRQFNPTEVNNLSPGMSLGQVEDRLGRPIDERVNQDGTRVEIWTTDTTAYRNSGGYGSGGYGDNGGYGNNGDNGGRRGRRNRGNGGNGGYGGAQTYALLFDQNGRFVQVLNGGGNGYRGPRGDRNGNRNGNPYP